MGAKRRPIAVIDAETDPFKAGRFPRPFLWGFYDGVRYEQFEYTDDLIDFLSGQRMLVYAHNGGKFDYHFFWDQIEPGEELTIINGRIAKFRIGNCEFRDSYNLLPVPLAQMQKDKIDYRIFEKGERDKPENRKAIEEYLRGDCVYLWEWITRFIEGYGLHLTTAGTALKTWERLAGRKAPRDMNGELYAELKPYYFGGRCESWHYGEFGSLKEKEPAFKMADINSAYPYAMLHPHPIGLQRYMGNGADEWEWLTPEQRNGAFLSVTGAARGCFPYRLPDGSLIFPDDGVAREYKVTGWEFSAAMDTGTFDLVEMGDFFYFDEFTTFEDYINHFYNLKAQAKKEGNDSTYLFAKLLMNSLYGKFGSNPENYREYMVAEMWQLDENGKAGDWEFNCLLGEDESTETIIVSQPQPDEKRKFYNIATAASITGFVRAFMWRSICQCEGVLYCDTDSIAAVDVSGLNYGTELGQWELEGIFDYGAFGGKKLYAMHKHGEPQRFNPDDPKTWKRWKLASKGIRALPRDLIRVAQGKAVTYQPEAPTYSVHSGPRFTPRTVSMQKKKVAPQPDS